MCQKVLLRIATNLVFILLITTNIFAAPNSKVKLKTTANRLSEALLNKEATIVIGRDSQAPIEFYTHLASGIEGIENLKKDEAFDLVGAQRFGWLIADKIVRKGLSAPSAGDKVLILYEGGYSILKGGVPPPNEDPELSTFDSPSFSGNDDTLLVALVPLSETNLSVFSETTQRNFKALSARGIFKKFPAYLIVKNATFINLSKEDSVLNEGQATKGKESASKRDFENDLQTLISEAIPVTSTLPKRTVPDTSKYFKLRNRLKSKLGQKILIELFTNNL